MKVYADYIFYTEKYSGELNENEFNRHALSVSQYIRNLTFGKADKYEGEELKYAVCEAVDVLYYVTQKNSAGGEKKSENTDGYSISYVVQGKDGETLEELSNRKMYEVIKKWLIPTGLLYSAVRCGHDHKHRYYDI